MNRRNYNSFAESEKENLDLLLDAILGFANKRIKNPAIRVRDMFDPLEAYFRGYTTKTGNPDRRKMRSEAIYKTEKVVLYQSNTDLTVQIERHHLISCENLWSQIIQQKENWDRESLYSWLENRLITIHITREEHLSIGKQINIEDPWSQFKSIKVLNNKGEEINI